MIAIIAIISIIIAINHYHLTTVTKVITMLTKKGGIIIIAINHYHCDHHHVDQERGREEALQPKLQEGGLQDGELYVGCIYRFVLYSLYFFNSYFEIHLDCIVLVGVLQKCQNSLKKKVFLKSICFFFRNI